MQTTIELPRQTRAAEVRAQSFDEASNTIDIIWTTGAIVRRASWMDGPYDEKLETAPENVRLERLNAGAAFLDTHDSYSLGSVIGSVVPGSARMAGGQGSAKIQLSRAAGAADIVQNIKDGVIRNISAGYLVHAVDKTERDDGSVPLWTVTDWEPVELSAVPVPADPGAQVRSRNSGDGVEMFPCRINRADPGSSKEASMADAPKPGDTGTKKPDAVEDIKEPKVKTEPDKPDSKKTAPATPVVDDGDASPIGSAEAERMVQAAVQRALADERARSAEIIGLAEKFDMRSFADEHVRQGTKLKEFRAKLIDKLAEERAQDGGPKGTALAPEPTLDVERNNDRAAGEAMARRALNKPKKG